jgi:two-component system response regulator FlrC
MSDEALHPVHGHHYLTDDVQQAKAASEEPLIIRSGLTVHQVEKTLIFETLKCCNQNRTQAAKLLGISIRTLRNKLAEYRGAE